MSGSALYDNKRRRAGARRRDRHAPKKRTKRSAAASGVSSLNRLAKRTVFCRPRAFLCRSFYGTFGAFAIVSGDASPMSTPSANTLILFSK